MINFWQGYMIFVSSSRVILISKLHWTKLKSSFCVFFHILVQIEDLKSNLPSLVRSTNKSLKYHARKLKQMVILTVKK